MKCRVSDFRSPDAQVHWSPESISERDTSLAQNPSIPLSIFRLVVIYVFFCRFNLSPIIHNTQFRRLTKPLSVCWYWPPPSGEPALLSSRFCFRDLLIWLNCIASAGKLIQEIAARIFKRRGHEKSAVASSIKKSDRGSLLTRRDYFSATSRGLISLWRFFSPHNFLRQYISDWNCFYTCCLLLSRKRLQLVDHTSLFTTSNQLTVKISLR